MRSLKPRLCKIFSGISRGIAALFVFLLAWVCYTVSDALTVIELPTGEHPAEIYANQLQDDLRKILITAIQRAERSIVLMIYSLSDQRVIQALKDKADQGVPVTVIVDAKASPKAKRQLGGRVKTIRRSSSGLMHLKVLVVDETQLWLGSTNFTYDSLRTHGNLMVEMDHPELAHEVILKAEQLPQVGLALPTEPIFFSLPEQKGELWFLPSAANADQRILQLMATAQKTLRVAMFTWTRPDFTEALIQANRRGIAVEVVIDRRQGQGAGAETVHRLKQAGVSVHLSSGEGLLHHKSLIVDDNIFVTGSANWTRSAFRTNDDCFLILEPLTKKQQDRLDELWQVLINLTHLNFSQSSIE